MTGRILNRKRMHRPDVSESDSNLGSDTDSDSDFSFVSFVDTCNEENGAVKGYEIISIDSNISTSEKQNLTGNINTHFRNTENNVPTQNLTVVNKNPGPKFSKSDLTEQKWWNVLKSLPVVGTIYGAFRTPVYACKGHRNEAWRSVAGSVGNLAGTGAAVAGALVSGPLIIPVIASIVGGGAVQQAVGGGGEVIIDKCNGDFQNKSADEKETLLYEKIFRDAPVVGSVYSLVRAGVYKFRNEKNPEEVNRSLRNAAINGVSSVAAVSLGYAASKAAITASNGSSKLATVVKRSRLLAKDALKTSPSHTTILVHEIENFCADRIPEAKEIVMQVMMILENSILCYNCKITKRLNFLVLNLLDKKFRQHFSSSSFLTMAVLRAGLPFFQAVLCLKPGTQEHINVAREFVEIGEEELTSDNVPHTERANLNIRLQLIRYFLLVLDPNPNYIMYQVLSDNAEQDIWTIRPELLKYRVQTEAPVTHKPTLNTTLDVVGLRVLNLDGGGTRGLLLLEFLEEIEKRTNYKISECFDYIIGTSTGGIIALCLALGSTVSDVREFYFRLKDKVFVGGKPYNETVLENELKKVFGDCLTMGHITGIKVIITASVRSGGTFDTYLFTNFDSETMNISLWEVARCTTAAPTFFDNFYLAELGTFFYDGGLGANNPTIESIDKITDYIGGEEGMENAIIISLGTGKVLDTNLDKLPLKLKSRFKSLLNGDLKKLLDILIDQVAQSDGKPVRQAQKACNRMKSFYYRLTPVLPEMVSLDETNDEVLINLIFHTKAYIATNITVINDICQYLCSRNEEF